MIKLASTDGEIVLLGMSDRNLELLRSGLPIMFDGSAIGLPGKRFCIFWGPTEEAIGEAIMAAGIIGPDARNAIEAAIRGSTA